LICVEPKCRKQHKAGIYLDHGHIKRLPRAAGRPGYAASIDIERDMRCIIAGADLIDTAISMLRFDFATASPLTFAPSAAAPAGHATTGTQLLRRCALGKAATAFKCRSTPPPTAYTTSATQPLLT